MRLIIFFTTIVIMACATSCNEQTEKKTSTVPDEVNSSSATIDTVPTVVNVKKLDASTFEIMATDHKAAVQNFHVLIKTKKFDEASLQEFVNSFRKERCSRQCNIHLYDSKSVQPLVTKYPLSNKEYLKVADHYVASSTFDMTEVWWYPYQDIKYKELGGKNWKKEPIE